jgi:Asp-tRNA(Asn)/Glu-tRNA(Gln) amidotransferase A subunit family amidase
MSQGLPRGMMQMGKHCGETTIHRAVHAFEQSQVWQTRPFG